MKKILILLLCINIVLAPTYAFANNLSGWTLSGPFAQGASTVYEGTKKVIIDGKNYLKKGSALITPNATQVAKTLAKGGAGYALTFAVQELLGAVDWVLDPANNQIKYWDESVKPYFIGQVGSPTYSDGKTREEACEMYAVKFNKENPSSSGPYVYDTVGIYGIPSPTALAWCYLGKWTYESYKASVVSADINVNPDELGQTDGEVKTYPLPAIADFLINKAEEGNTTAQGATLAAAADIVAEAETDDAKARPIVQQLEASASTTAEDTSAQESSNEAKGETKPNESGGTDLSLQFPAFCGWAPLVCEAAQSAIKFPTTVQNWWNTATQAISASWLSFKEWLDWTKNDSELPDTETNQVTELPIPELQENAISWSASCPPDVQVPINLYGQSSTLTFSWSPWCQLLNIIKPAIIASAYIGAAFIVLGLRT